MRLFIFAFLLAFYMRQTEQLLYKINISNYGRYRLSAYIDAMDRNISKLLHAEENTNRKEMTQANVY
jgi:hypothetical protein